MKQKITALSIASMLLITPIHSSFAQTHGAGSSVSGTETEASSASANDTASHTGSSESRSETGASSASTNDTASQSSSSESRSETGASSTSTNDTASQSSSSESRSETGASSASTNDTASQSGSSDSRSEKGASSAPTNDTASQSGSSETRTEAGENTFSTTAAHNGATSSESRLGDGKEGFDFDITEKPFDSSFEEVMKLSWSVEEFRSKIDPSAYEQYLKEQQAETNLFELKQNIDYNSTIANFQQLLKASPDNNNLYVELALTYLANGDLNNAKEIAKQLDVRAPESYLSLIVKAEMAGRQDKSDEKQLYLEQAVEKNPTSAVVRFKLGEELAKAGKSNEAITHLSTAAALNPKNLLVFEELNKVFAQTNNTELKTFVNGVVPKFEVLPFIENGFTLMPARAIAESLGANVEWEEASQQVSIQRGETTILLTNESNAAIVNGQEFTIDAPAKIVNGSMVLPLRFVAESLGAKVDWKAESQMIVISE
ncbi:MULTISPECIES: copper amine oxidase N-terminal domain-containing protein [unclassified Paenibacillus]|uniref:copper amine oxidase N-terminal domain-containing protein n=1 Tax=unclassified Paenibacillus TaxID=185978 RepID=UPI001AEA87B0|nr:MULTISPECIES: copper amine oxidase N-terminal domain-containing protein [unclassified Paenibacillus]MBP1156791.1 tetratricopeptide (TPR) repeat protein [Paenibacillus sp. PvP091]MBP1172470.1 tetratricopeptide (TPR) repeat protein [Paenibacillus sp. PvR098]MBP2438851.1 tetratricopeptide (TPR) repeat protein [Paenibacillus sp. PvP052]